MASRLTNLERERSGATSQLGNKVGAFVDGGANFLSAIGIPLQLGIGIIAVLVACFAATTLDSATRLQRYVIQELGTTMRIPPLKNIYVATIVAVTLGGAIAMLPASAGGKAGTGGLLLWPLFGATNQLLAGLAFMVTVFYLWRRNKPIWFVVIPMVIMIIMPAWTLCWQLFNSETGWCQDFRQSQIIGYGWIDHTRSSSVDGDRKQFWLGQKRVEFWKNRCRHWTPSRKLNASRWKIVLTATSIL